MDITSFLQLAQASCIDNSYKSGDAIKEIKWANGSFDRCSYYKINVEVLTDKDYIEDVKNRILQVQMDDENT